MTTYMTLGRCEFAEPPTSIDQSGPFLSIVGDLVCDSYAELSARRAQLNGMVENPDEDVFPATFTETPEMDGFYAVESVQVGTSVAAMVGFVAPYSVTLRQVADYSSPTGELSTVAVLRSGTHGLTPSARVTRPYGQWGGPIYSIDRTTATGVQLERISVDTTTTTTTAFAADPATWYSGSATVQVQGADSTWYPWTNRGVPEVDLDEIRLDNDLVRVWFDQATGELVGQWWDGAVWDEIRYDLLFNSGLNAFVPYGAATIVSNSVDRAVMRVAHSWRNAATQVTVTLDAGARFFVVSLANVTGVSGSDDWTVRRATTEASTAITAGLRATSDNANGNRYVLAAASVLSTDLVNGEIEVDVSGGSVGVMVGCEINGSTAAAPDRAADLVGDFIRTVNAKTRIVAR